MNVNDTCVCAECVATVESEASSSTQQAQQAPGQQQQQGMQNGSGEGAGYVSKRSVRLQRSFPLTAVVGMDMIKQALLLGACDTGAPLCLSTGLPGMHCPDLSVTDTKVTKVSDGGDVRAGLGGICIAGKRGTCKVRTSSTPAEGRPGCLWPHVSFYHGVRMPQQKAVLAPLRSRCWRGACTRCCRP